MKIKEKIIFSQTHLPLFSKQNKKNMEQTSFDKIVKYLNQRSLEISMIDRDKLLTKDQLDDYKKYLDEFKYASEICMALQNYRQRCMIINMKFNNLDKNSHYLSLFFDDRMTYLDNLQKQFNDLVNEQNALLKMYEQKILNQ